MKTTLETRWPSQTECFSEEKADSCFAITAERGWAKSFFLPWNACLHCRESKADFSAAPGVGRAGGRGRARRAEPECVQWCGRSAELLSWESAPALLSWACPQVTGNLTFLQGTLDPLWITRALGVHGWWGWEEKVAGIKKRKKERKETSGPLVTRCSQDGRSVWRGRLPSRALPSLEQQTTAESAGSSRDLRKSKVLTPRLEKQGDRVWTLVKRSKSQIT